MIIRSSQKRLTWNARPIRRRRRAQVFLELPMVACMMIAFAAIACNVSVVSMAAELNDRACRDACRSAAEGDDADTAYQLALAALAGHGYESPFFGKPELVAGLFYYEDYQGNAPVNQSPYVSVTTRMTLAPPSPIVFMGTTLGSFENIVAERTYRFPIVKLAQYFN